MYQVHRTTLEDDLISSQPQRPDHRSPNDMSYYPKTFSPKKKNHAGWNDTYHLHLHVIQLRHLAKNKQQPKYDKKMSIRKIGENKFPCGIDKKHKIHLEQPIQLLLIMSTNTRIFCWIL